MKNFVVLLFLINVSFVSGAPTLCNNIVQSVSQVAYSDYLSFSGGLFLTFFSNPSKNDQSFFAKLKRFLIRTAVIQFMAILSLMTFMTTRFFTLNNLVLPEFLRVCSLAMYGCCGVMTLTHFIGRNMISICSCNAHTTRFFRIVTRAVIFIPIYVIQMIFQVYLKNNFPSTGYMFAFQWISILSILFAIPLCILIIIEKLFWSVKLLYIFIYPFVFQIYLHVGYVCFFLYCDEDFISSVLLLASGFALGNVLKSAFYLIFPRNIWETIPDRARTKDNYNANPNSSYDELSFSKGEILENANDNGKWWLLARNQNGETGFVQINYVSLYNSAHLFFYE
ncbi:unnamed protein product [Rhizophagus irregularis]|uniref:SH3 domain-containing protein n=1 Tax=Rhizophagus irregularis TaxID=588596 RepID=A0A915ZXH2_9GLOM|nr:unnamed protein product [Rhizophagus irregularis]CAB5145455.1 unnamed protein product [Rhizophagus irregularis]CAB5390997.1 unnamed protein product [Rhizophagus irregularis]